LLENQLVNIMMTKNGFLDDLQYVNELKLPQCYIAAGYIRNYCWNYLSNYETSTPLNDLDVIYFDPDNLTYDQEIKFEQQLNAWKPQYNWSIKNQARMHITNHTIPYTSTLDAMRYWPETATAVGMRLVYKQNIEVIAPYGLDDLMQMRIRKTDLFTDEQYYHNRYQSKGWLSRWPLLQVIN